MQAIVFPFDQFGSAGTGAGAELLGDALREMLADARRETRPARSDAFRDHVRVREFTFDTPAAGADWRKTARQAVRSALKADDGVLWLAGNHLAVLPAYEELGADALVLQLDAHLDIYNLADCTEELSHGNFLLHAEGPLPAIVNIGSRDLFLPAEHWRRALPGGPVGRAGRGRRGRRGEARRGLEPQGQASLDRHRLRRLRSGVFPGRAAPAADGPGPGVRSSAACRTIWSERVAGVSLSEFDPGRDRNDQISRHAHLADGVVLTQMVTELSQSR